MKSLPVKLRKVKVNPGDTLIFTIGNVKAGIIPTSEDLEKFRLLAKSIFPDNDGMVLPDIVKVKVLKKKRGETK